MYGHLICLCCAGHIYMCSMVGKGVRVSVWAWLVFVFTFFFPLGLLGSFINNGA